MSTKKKEMEKCICIQNFLFCIGVSLPGGSEVKVSACNAGDLGSILGQEDPLEKEMAIHSSILTRRIPWTEEPGGLR